MEIVTTFVPNLYAFQFPKEEFDELERVFDDWKNQLFLFDFFTENEADLKGAFTIEEAVEKTREEVKKFRRKMLDLASSNPHQLNEFFANLYNNEYQLSILQRQKAKLSWLRLYALKITQEDKEDLYVITGGMIKLTKNMEDKSHGEKERTKINQCRDYLKTIGVYDLESFFEICF
jgi:CRISPR/Cas system-associated endonuclease/helicase Cas3